MTPTPEQFAALLDDFACVCATLGEEQSSPFPVDTRGTLIEQTKARTAVLGAYAQATGGAIREMSCDSPMAAEGGDGRRREPTELQTPSPFEQSLIGEPGGNNKQPLPKGLQDISPIARGAGGAVKVPDEPVAWVIPGDGHARDGGWLDAMAWSEGEFTKPLYAHPPAEAATARLRELERDAARYRYIRENSHEFVGRDRGMGPETLYCDDLDAAIDKALQEQPR